MNKNNKIKNILTCLTAGILLLGAVQKTGEFLDPLWAGGAMNAVEAFHELDENTVDVMVYGSSHAWKGFDPIELYKNTGIGSYNYGCNWQHINTTRLFLKDSLKSQSPKVALIETYRVDEMLKDTDLNGEIYYTKKLPWSEDKRKYLQECFGKNPGGYISYCFPLVMFHENWNIVSKENFKGGRTTEEYLSSMGYEPGDRIEKVKLADPYSFRQKELPEFSVNILDDMVQTCRDKNIRIVFFTVPYQGEYCYSDAMKRYAGENGCEYLNLFEYTDEMGINENCDFRDTTHLNDSGAKKVTAFIGEFLDRNFQLTNKQNIEGNLWEK